MRGVRFSLGMPFVYVMTEMRTNVQIFFEVLITRPLCTYIGLDIFQLTGAKVIPCTSLRNADDVINTIPKVVHHVRIAIRAGDVISKETGILRHEQSTMPRENTNT